MVIQVVRVVIRPERRDRWLEVIRANLIETRRMEGCESYHVAEDIEAPNGFLIIERWASLDALYGHFRAPEFGELMRSLDDLVAGPPEVGIHEVASTLTLDDALAKAIGNS